MPSLTINFITNCKNRWSRYALREKEGTMFKLGRVCKDVMQEKKKRKQKEKIHQEFMIGEVNNKVKLKQKNATIFL